ncbi:MAG: MFS transporter, partial [Atribacterota bacterium]|nr:MFS transporter [Atribacterota bacterium]
TLAGIFWPGIDLVTNNLLLKLSPTENRSLYVGVLNFFLGTLGTALAYLVGGYILERVVPLLSSLTEMLFGWQMIPYYYVFLFSSLLRFLSFQIFLPKIEEPGARTLRTMMQEVCKRQKKP